MKYLPTYGILLLLFLSATRLAAQGKVQVVTKTVERTFAYQPGDIILLQGEKSTIQVSGWTNKEVKVILRLIAKAPSADVAREALDAQRYILEKKKDRLHLKNYFVVPRGKAEIKAILLAEYELWVPREANLTISNQYGNTTIANKSGQTTVDTRFGNIVLDQVSGTGRYKNYFGDFTARNIGGQVEGQFNHTKTSVQGLSGAALFNSTLGDVSLSGLAALQSLKVVAAKSDVSLATATPQAYRYQFSAEFGDIVLPKMGKVPPVSKAAEAASWQYGAASLPAILVKTSFGLISLDIK